MKDRSKLIQEDYEGTDHFPWKVLVICQCLNQATWMVAEKVVETLFREFPSPDSLNLKTMKLYVACRTEDRVTEILRPLGFGTKREARLVRMSEQYVEARELYKEEFKKYWIEAFSGCGQYARDAWDLFVLKKSCEPEDRLLKKYSLRKKNG